MPSSGTSSQKRDANRRNALRSTGPKGAEGKRRASLNATRHGLSTPIHGDLLGLQIQQITELIGIECASDLEAMELARRILDYERNESVQRMYLHQEHSEDPRKWTAGQILEATRNQFPEHDMLDDVLMDGKESAEPISSKELKQALDWQREMLALTIRSARVVAAGKRREQERSVRYLRRAANQLAKMVKGMGGKRPAIPDRG